MDIGIPKRSKKQGGKKARKYGRNRKKCEAYRAAGRREKNKARRIARDNRRAEHAARIRAANVAPEGD